MDSASRSLRRYGAAATLAGGLGLVSSIPASLAFFATTDGARELESAWFQGWVEPASDLLAPLLTFDSPEGVSHAYERLSSIIFAGFLAGLVGVHGSQSKPGRLEAWGFRLAFLGYLLLVIRFLKAWIEGLDFDAGYVLFGLPGLLLTLVGSTLFGVATLRGRDRALSGALLLALSIPLFIVCNGALGSFAAGLLPLELAWFILGYELWTAKLVSAVRLPTST